MFLSYYLLHRNSKTCSNSIGFADDWAIVYSRVLRSFGNTQKFMNFAKNLELYHDDQRYYSVSTEYSESNLEEGFLKLSILPSLFSLRRI